ncbi:MULTISPECIES: hypothetical protein [Chryseobacterium]|uniref:DUF4369 domain-containing protein n=1 Tax=Chryseobacterium salivictor TaxID=2547600 RepID=A0A4P6ZEQ5_9FLAO|nr:MULTISPECIES: hypothetical protein [Chryseobacterium]MDQ0476110.1 hypothetical protein [Chryseobacterium sp. MDT2-18]QBO57965.1 hypothetical protein NBC122_01137 [Chryseobacterium salivictor]
MQRFFAMILLFSLCLFVGCTSENRNNSRAYVEGKITGSQSDFNKIKIIIKSDEKNIGETMPTGSGQFNVSGPLLSDSFSLVLNEKIKSFSSSKPGCTISSDSLEILIPSGTTYIIFNDINLK